MPQPAIRIDNLSKCVQLVGRPLANANLTENLRRAGRRAWNKVKAILSPGSAPTDNVYWAVKDVSSDVHRAKSWASSAAMGPAKARC